MSKREITNTATYTRHGRCDDDGRFEEGGDVSRSLSADARHGAKHKIKPGEGEQGNGRH